MMYRPGILCIALATGIFVLAPNHRAGAQSISVSGAQPVLVELFTSEGCKSCPAAERVLSELKNRDGVITLAWHVDYWDNERWSDPFSNKAFSSRQIAYARSFGSERIYTPQMIVDGRAEFNGSDRSKADHAIGAAQNSPKARITMITHPSEDGPGTIVACLRVEGLSDFAPGQVAGIILVVAEDNLRVSIGGGENASRTLEHDAVVRWARIAGETSGEVFERDVSVPLNPAWKSGNLRLVAFLQDRETQHILAAKSVVFGYPANTE